MEKFIHGFSGCGKTSKLLKEVEVLLKDGNYSASELAFLTFTKVQKDELISKKNTISTLKDICVLDMGELLRSFLSIEVNESFINRHIIDIISEDIFTNDYSLKALLKSETFSQELYELFCLFRKNEIRYKDLSDILKNISLCEVDFHRFKLVFEVYEEYCKSLDNLGYYDYYGLISAVESKAFKKYKYLFVDDGEEISPILRKLISRISENVFFVEDIAFSKENRNYTSLSQPKRNADIFLRADAMRKNFLEHFSQKNLWRSSDNLKYFEFVNFEDELAYIAEDIKRHLLDGLNFSDFAIVPSDLQKKQQLVDFLSAENLPLNVVVYCEKFRNFKEKMLRYLNLCICLKKLGIKEFSKDAFCGLEFQSKVDGQVYLEEFDLSFENLLSDIFEDIYIKDRFVFLNSLSKSKLLLLSVYNNLDILCDTDKLKFFDEMNILNVVYSKFLEFDYVAIFDILQNDFYTDESKDLLKKCRNYLYSISILYEKIGRNLRGDIVLKFFENNSLNILSGENCVNILSFNEIRQREFKYVYIPSLSDDKFPRYSYSTYFVSHDGNNKVSAELQKKFSGFSEIVPSDEFIFYEDLKNLYYAMLKAKNGVVLSFHSLEGNRRLSPSVFLEFFKNNDSENFSVVSANLSQKYDNLSCSVSDKKKSKVVFEDDDILKLNPSSISTFLSCERKFFYQNILNLKEKSSFQATYGSVVHSILEVFNKTCLANYTKDKLISIAEILFNSKQNEDEAFDVGFSQLVVSLIESTDDLSLSEMKKKFLSAVDDMARGGFFEEIPDSVCCEKSFEFELPGVERVVINGKIDAILSTNGEYSLVDYKTGEPKQSLSYYLSDYGVNFESDSSRNKGVFNENNIKNYQYQIPLYYLALQNSDELSEFKNKVKKLGLKYIRPSIRGEKRGYLDDFISSDEIEKKQDRIVDNLSTTVVNKIRNISYFSKTSDKRRCSLCSYAFLCGEGDTVDEN